MEKKKIRNASVDLFRFMCAVLVVAIHTNPFQGLGTVPQYVVNQMITRIAVPFFLCTMGYFYIQKIQAGKKPFKGTVMKLLQIYVIWSVIYLAKEFVLQVLVHGEPISSYLKKSIWGIFVDGSSGHFWFFPAVIYTMIIINVCEKIGILKHLAVFSIVLYAVGVLGCAYWGIGNQIPGFRLLINSEYFVPIRRIFMMGLPFFMQGYFLNKISLEKIKKRKLYVALPVVILLWIMEIGIVNALGIADSIIITYALYPLLFVIMQLLLATPMSQHVKKAAVARDMANFMYYSHVLVIWILLILGKKLYLSSTNIFLLTVFLTAGSGFILNKMNNKYLNLLFK